MSEKDENKKDENKKEENENDESEKNMDCWEGCYDEKTQWAMKMQSKIIDDIEYNYCPKCNTAWPLDWDQYRVTPHEVKQRSLNQHFKHKEQNPELFEDD